MSSNTPVLVTGGSGYLASWIVKQLLDAGRDVHATVRNFGAKEKYRHLERLAPRERLRLYEADLRLPGSFDAAMRGCETVIHTASPFRIEAIEDPDAELIAPAVEGVANVLAAVDRTDSVKRVVMTSSAVAVYGDSIDAREKPNGVFTEDDWNHTSSREHQPYSYSKTLAERRAWEIAGAQRRWSLVTILPGFLLGPALDPATTGVSNTIMTRLAEGGYRSGIIDLRYGIADVRDAARAHVLAADRPEASGRYIVSARAASLVDVAKILRVRFGDDYPLPRRTAPKWLAWLLAPRFGFTRRFVRLNVGIPIELDHSRSVRELGMTYTPIERAIIEHFEQMIASGRARPSPSPSRGREIPIT